MNTPTQTPTASLRGGSFLERGTPAWPWLAAAFLLIITILAYMPAILHGGFIWDDDAYVPGSTLQRSLQGLQYIWTKLGTMRGGTGQYYPLTYSAFWVEYHLFQLQPLGYHLVNVLLHALNAVLVWQILRRLSVPGALLAAGIFALHPVHVESVAWVTELKNVLSGLFYLLSLLCYLRFLGIDGPEPPAIVKPEEAPHGRRTFYFLAVILFICALAGKTVTATLPAVILLILWWKTGRIGWGNMLPTAPMFMLSAGSGLLTVHLEKMIGASGYEWALTPVEHFLLAGRILWFYAGKIIWPGKLVFIYPRWEVNSAVWWQYLFPLAAIAVIAVLWIIRKRTGRGPLTAALFFAGTLVPVLGFLNVYPMRYSYVADHFQYLASLGPIALLAAGAVRILLLPGLRSAGAGLRNAAMPAAGAVLLTLGLMTWRQSWIYKNADQIWIDTIEKNPACWMAHNNLGVSLFERGKLEEAITHYRKTLLLKPDYAEAHNNLGVSLSEQSKFEEAIKHYREALRLKPDFAETHDNWGRALARRGKMAEAVTHHREALRLKPNFAEAHDNYGLALAGQGKLEEAIAHYREALRLRPDFANAHNNLGVALAGQGKLEEAIAHYREALRLKPDFANAHNNWGVALAGQGKLEEAIAHYREALRLKPDSADAYYNLGVDLSMQGKLEEARANYREALRLRPDLAKTHNQ